MRRDLTDGFWLGSLLPTRRFALVPAVVGGGPGSGGGGQAGGGAGSGGSAPTGGGRPSDRPTDTGGGNNQGAEEEDARSAVGDLAAAKRRITGLKRMIDRGEAIPQETIDALKAGGGRLGWIGGAIANAINKSFTPERMKRELEALEDDLPRLEGAASAEEVEKASRSPAAAAAYTAFKQSETAAENREMLERLSEQEREAAQRLADQTDKRLRDLSAAEIEQARDLARIEADLGRELSANEIGAAQRLADQTDRRLRDLSAAEMEQARDLAQMEIALGRELSQAEIQSARDLATQTDRRLRDLSAAEIESADRRHRETTDLLRQQHQDTIGLQRETLDFEKQQFEASMRRIDALAGRVASGEFDPATFSMPDVGDITRWQSPDPWEGTPAYEQQTEYGGPTTWEGTEEWQQETEWDPETGWKGFTAEDLQDDPGYAFRQQEGQKAIRRQAAAGGLGGSGATIKAALRFSQELASQEFGRARARSLEDYRTQRLAEREDYEIRTEAERYGSERRRRDAVEDFNINRLLADAAYDRGVDRERDARDYMRRTAVEDRNIREDDRRFAYQATRDEEDTDYDRAFDRAMMGYLSDHNARTMRWNQAALLSGGGTGFGGGGGGRDAALDAMLGRRRQPERV